MSWQKFGYGLVILKSQISLMQKAIKIDLYGVLFVPVKISPIA
jgi:hypothetical protein